MKKTKGKKSAKGEEVLILEVTRKDYEESLRRGWTDDDMIKPGLYKFRRGVFLALHPELKIDEKKRA